MGNNHRLRNLLKLTIKIAVTGISLWFVFRKIDYAVLYKTFLTTRPGWMLPATLLFLLSKIVSSYRLNLFFRCIHLRLSERTNLRLYWLGMFYNIFLPGGIGGDGYKIYVLNKKFNTPVKKLFNAVLLDRISGLMALFFLSALLFVITFTKLSYIFVAISLIIAGALLLFFIYKKFFSGFAGVFYKTNIQGLAVQLLQVLCAWCLLKSTGIESGHPAYLLVFLLSSVVAVIPFTIGGLGARELTFLLASQKLGLNAELAVSVSFWFYIITLLVSFAGIVWVYRSPFQTETVSS
jgi:glycosyltransferase 2 family protein